MNEPTSILIIEDEQQIRETVAASLECEGFTVHQAGTARHAAILAAEKRPDMLVLDLGLPDRNGVDFIRDYRAWSATPILILSARTEEKSKVDALDAGADDYLVKPVDLDELAARLRALLRRSAGRAAPVLQRDDLQLDPAARSVSLAGQPIDLPARAFTLLQLLLENAGRVLSRSQIEQSLYGWRDEPDSNALEVHIHHLRKKLGSELIRTVRGVGYTIPK